MGKLALKLLQFLPLVIAGIVSFALWYFLFKSFFKLQKEKKLSYDISTEIILGIQKTSNSITTLSSAAILLTFSVLRVVGENLSDKTTLTMSWYFFGICIGIGVIIGISVYILKTHYLILLKHAIPAVVRNGSEENKKRVTKLAEKVYNFEKVLFIFAFLQPMTFFAAMCYAISFAVKNI